MRLGSKAHPDNLFMKPKFRVYEKKRFCLAKGSNAGANGRAKLHLSRGRANPGSDGASPYPEPRPTWSLALPGASL
jgi:hypothetical protein